MKRNTYLLLLSLFIASMSIVSAREYRSPYTLLFNSHDFDTMYDDGWHFSFDLNAYNRSAHESIMKHGTNTEPLTSLFFNKSEFRLSQIFEGCLVPIKSKYYNPYLRVLKIKPRAHYDEHGIHFSMSAFHELFNGGGSIGFRATMPFKVVEIERKDSGGRRDQQIEDVMKGDRKKFGTTQVLSNAFRADYIEALPQSADLNAATDYTSTGATIFDGQADSAAGADLTIGVIYSPEGHAPRGKLVGIATGSTTAKGATALPVDLSGLEEGALYRFVTNTDYTGLADENVSSIEELAALQDKKADLWYVLTHDATDGSLPNEASSNLNSNRPLFTQQYSSNHYEWFHDRGYSFDSDKAIGIGDLDLELFYRPPTSQALLLEAVAGVKLPTASGNDYSGNPYKAVLGNGEHFELKFGGRMEYEIYQKYAIELSANYNFVLSGTEFIPATPKDTFIKNIGPREKANVDWSYFIGNAAIHFAHPRSLDVTGVLGYQFYIKTKESIHYANAARESWLGKTYDATTTDYTVEHLTNLSNTLASANTDTISHRFYGAICYHLSDWCSARVGGAYTFAGQHCMQDADLTASMSVRV